MTLASLLVPSLRWDAAHGFEYLRDTIDDALELGVGGFLISGGPRDAVATLASGLHARSRAPLLLAADVERGAGQQFDGCIALPPLAALGRLGDLDAVHRAGKVTAREMKQLGLNWALAPVCDLDVEFAPGSESPIVGTRAAGAASATVAAVVERWIDACQAEGVLACAKHYPGHGRADRDSHLALPMVHARGELIRHEDMVPFGAAIDAGVGSAMTAHVAYPLLDASGAPATLSARILGELRDTLAFDGLVVSDALDMEGVLAAGAEADVAVRAIAAGCDALLAPADVAGTARALDRAAQRGELDAERVRDAIARRDRWALWARPAAGRETTLDDTMWARQFADRTLHLVRGAMPRIGEAVEVVEVDDDASDRWAAVSRAHFGLALRALGVDAPAVSGPTAGTRVPVIVAAYADVVAWKGSAGFSVASRSRIEDVMALAAAQRREALVVLFSHPRHAAQLPVVANILCAWGGERPMQEAAARAVHRGP